MTTPATPTPTRTASANESGTPSSRTRASSLSFSGILVSELIKLWTLRSTVWCCAIVVALAFGIGLLIAGFTGSQPGTIPVAGQQALAVSIATIGVALGQLVLSVLGVLVISGEYGTGMIRSTLSAVPKRIPALLGKAIVLAVTAFALGLVTIYGTALIQLPFLSNVGIHTNFADPKLNLALLGGAAYLALIALMAFGIGAIIRNSAGGIATALGLLLVAPSVLQLVAGWTRTTWPLNVDAFLPTSAGGHLFVYGSETSSVTAGVISLNATSGGLVLLAWAALAIVVAAILLRRRDA